MRTTIGSSSVPWWTWNLLTLFFLMCVVLPCIYVNCKNVPKQRLKMSAADHLPVPISEPGTPSSGSSSVVQEAAPHPVPTQFDISNPAYASFGMAPIRYWLNGAKSLAPTSVATVLASSPRPTLLNQLSSLQSDRKQICSSSA